MKAYEMIIKVDKINSSL